MATRSRRDNTHRLLFYLEKCTSGKYPEWRSLALNFLFELYEARASNSGLFFWVRAADGITIYLGNKPVVYFHIRQRHLLIHAQEGYLIFSKGDRLFGRQARHDGSWPRMWKVDNEEALTALSSFIRDLPAVRERQAKASRTIPQHVREEVWNRDGGRCTVCGVADNLHFDHIIPFSKKGTSSDAKNIRILCQKHNLEQGASMRY